MIDEKELYRKARGKVRAIKGFLNHLLTYLTVCVFLFVLNYLTSPDDYWVQWPAIGWGIFVVFHFLRVFVTPGFLGREWEDRKIREYMDKERQRMERMDGKV